jgi:hypothetical protein
MVLLGVLAVSYGGGKKEEHSRRKRKEGNKIKIRKGKSVMEEKRKRKNAYFIF